MGYEAGKNRLECVGDVEEGADLIAYYCDQIEQHNGFVEKMGTLGPGEENVSVLRPYGVWAVISPFNFPLALAAGPAGGALVAGNTVVFKPASDTPLLGAQAYRDGRSRPACRPACSTSSPGRDDRRARSSSTTTASTASSSPDRRKSACS